MLIVSESLKGSQNDLDQSRVAKYIGLILTPSFYFGLGCKLSVHNSYCQKRLGGDGVTGSCWFFIIYIKYVDYFPIYILLAQAYQRYCCFLINFLIALWRYPASLQCYCCRFYLSDSYLLLLILLTFFICIYYDFQQAFLFYDCYAF